MSRCSREQAGCAAALSSPAVLVAGTAALYLVCFQVAGDFRPSVSEKVIMDTVKPPLWSLLGHSRRVLMVAS